MRSPFGLRSGISRWHELMGGGFSPAVLFANNEPGVWYDPSDLTTLFQDTAGTTPVTTPGQTVALMLDKSKGLTLGPELVTNGTFDTDTGWTKGTGWTIADGVASHVAGASGALTASGTATTIGKFYTLTFDLTVSAGVLNVSCGGFTTPNLGASGSFSYVFLASLSNFAVPFAAGTFAGTIDNISIRELPGFHAVQGTAAARPTYGIVPATGRRNLLTFTEQFDNAAWVTGATGSATAPIKTANAGVSPSGAVAGRVQLSLNGATTTGDISLFRQAVTMAAGAHTHAIYLRSFDGASSYILQITAADGSGETITVTGEWQKFTVSAASPGGALNMGVRLRGGLSPANSNTADILYAEPQVEVGSTDTAYQKVTTQFDVTEAGVESLGYLSFDGVDDFMITPTITPGIDKVQVFAGVRKLSTASGWIAETGIGIENGSLALIANYLGASGTANVGAVWTGFSMGTGFRYVVSPTNYAAPITSVVGLLGDISGDRATLRIDGTQVAQNTGDQGTGNYLAYPMYIGSRAGTSNRFNGQIYSLITRFGDNLEVAQIESTEAYVAGKTAGVTL
jgi:hypothetical protein